MQLDYLIKKDAEEYYHYFGPTLGASQLVECGFLMTGTGSTTS